jgi:hypothetical protein
LRARESNHGHLLAQEQDGREQHAQHKGLQPCGLQRDARGISRRRALMHTFAGLLFGLKLVRD